MTDKSVTLLTDTKTKNRTFHPSPGSAQCPSPIKLGMVTEEALTLFVPAILFRIPSIISPRLELLKLLIFLNFWAHPILEQISPKGRVHGHMNS